MPVTEEGHNTSTTIPAWRTAQAAVARDRFREDCNWDSRLHTELARDMVLSARSYFGSHDCTPKEAFEAVRKNLPAEEGSDKDVDAARSYFLQLMDEVSHGSTDRSRV